jgi:hypothetical protein
MSDTFRNMQTIKKNRGRYRIKKPFSPKHFLLMLGAMAAILAVLVVVAVLLRIRVASLLVFALPIPLATYVTKRTAFGATAQAVVVDGVNVPWEHVREIAVTGPLPNGETMFAVRLGDTPPLPDGLRELTPGPDGFHVRHSTASRYNPAKLRAALQRYAPAQVTLSGPSGFDSLLSGEEAR